MSYSLGVDLGTTFVAAAIADASRVEMFTLGDRAVVSPATVYLREDGTLATGEAANRRAVSNPDRVGREFKRRLGNPTPVILGGEPYSVTTLLGSLLRDVLEKVTQTEGEPPECVMLTHPANWGPFRRALFEEVPPLAGLDNPPMTTEPEAAAAHYAASRYLADGETVAVYDLGGGTFDATVLRQQHGGIEVLGTPEGIERLGGIDFDEAILSYVDYTAGGALSELDLRDPQTTVALARLRQDCVLAKEALSVDTETTLPVFLPHQHFDVHLTRSEFEDMARAPIESTIGALHRTLQSAQVEAADLSAVLLVGGSSRIPLVARMVSAELGRPTVVNTHPKHAVALGAAALASTAAQAEPAPQAHQALPQAVPRQRTAAAPPRTNNRAGMHPRREAVATVEVAGSASPPPPPPPPPPRFDLPLPEDLPVMQGNGPVSQGEPARAAEHRWRRRPVLIVGGLLGLAVLLAVVVVVGMAVSGDPDRQPAPSPAPAAPVAPEPAAPPSPQPVVAIPTLGAPIKVGQNPKFVAFSPNGQQAYVAQAKDQVIAVVDTAINRVTATIPTTAGPPQFLEFSPDGRTLYVSIFNDEATIHLVDVIDTASNTVVATIPQQTRPYPPAVSPDGKTLYIPDHDTGTIGVVDTATNKVTAEIRVPPNPHWVAFTPDGSRAYTANHTSNLITVIDTATRTVLTTIPVQTSPHSVAMNPQRPQVANVNYDAHSLSVIDTTTNKVVATIQVGKNPQDLAWTPDGRFIYTVNNGDNTVSVVDTTTNLVTATIPTEASPTSIAVQPDSKRALVTNSGSGTLTVLELAP